MSELDLDAIEARAKAATPGPWNYEHDTELEKGCRCGSCLEPIDGRMIVESRKHDMVAVADARFIAHAREDVPALIAELRRLREENARLELQLRIVQCPFDHVIMYANGKRECDSCGWTRPLPKPPEVG